MIETGRCQTSNLTSVADRTSVVTAILPPPAIFARGEPAVPPACARHVSVPHALGWYMTWIYQIGPGYIKL